MTSAYLDHPPLTTRERRVLSLLKRAQHFNDTGCPEAARSDVRLAVEILEGTVPRPFPSRPTAIEETCSQS